MVERCSYVKSISSGAMIVGVKLKVLLVVVLVGNFENAFSHPNDYPVDNYTSIHPHFKQSFYINTFKDGKLDGLVVTVEYGNGSFPAIIQEDMNRYFEVTAGSTTQEFVVKSRDGVFWDKHEDAIFTLEINATIPVETVVIVKKEELEQLQLPQPPYFEKFHYITSFEDRIIKDVVVTVINGNGHVPGIKDLGLTFHFEVIKDQDPEKFIVKTKNGTKWSFDEEVIITLGIYDKNLLSPVETVVIARKEEVDPPQPPQPPAFEKSYYITSFEDGIIKDVVVTVINGNGYVPVIKDLGLTFHFEVIKHQDPEKFIVKTKNGTKWSFDEEVVITVGIYDKNLLSPVETVVIARKEEVGQREPPCFEKSYYTGSYKDGQLSNSDDIKLIGSGKGDVRLEDPEMEQLFTVKNTNGLVTIENIGPIEVDVEEILLTLFVEYDGMRGSTVVLIKIVKVEPSCEGGNKYTFFLGDNHGVIVGF